MRYIIRLSSDRYGEEEFRYRTFALFRAGLNRFLTSVNKSTKEDGIHRTLTVEVWNQ